jgi:hypothetical protein
MIDKWRVWVWVWIIEKIKSSSLNPSTAPRGAKKSENWYKKKTGRPSKAKKALLAQ